MVVQELADDLGVSRESLQYTAGSLRVQKQLIAAVTGYNQVGDANTALNSSSTFYFFLVRMPKAGTLNTGVIRAENKGASASTTIDILKVASGTAVTAGTAIVTQVAANGLTASTDFALTVNTDGTQNIAQGSVIVAKIVTQANETLKPPLVDLEFKL